MKLDKLSDDELVARNQELMTARDEIREQQLAIKRELSERAANRRVTEALEGLSDDERDAVIAGVAASAGAKGEVS